MDLTLSDYKAPAEYRTPGDIEPGRPGQWKEAGPLKYGLGLTLLLPSYPHPHPQGLLTRPQTQLSLDGTW